MVIQAVAINVVDNFPAADLSPQLVMHHNPMHGSIPASVMAKDSAFRNGPNQVPVWAVFLHPLKLIPCPVLHLPPGPCWVVLHPPRPIHKPDPPALRPSADHLRVNPQSAGYHWPRLPFGDHLQDYGIA